MANFVRKMLVRTKSRSKSPVKYSNEFQHWAHPEETKTQQFFLPYSAHGYHRNTFEDNICGVNCATNQSNTSNIARAPLAIPEFSHIGLSARHYEHSQPSPANSTPANEYAHPPEPPIWNTMTTQASQTSLGSHRSELHPSSRITTEHMDTLENYQILDAREPRFQYPNFQSNLTLASQRTPDGSQRTHDSLWRNNYGTLESQSHTTMSRPRSNSPIKTARSSDERSQKKSRSKSPRKKPAQINATLDYLSSQCETEGCSAAIIVQDTRFLVCKHQLSHASEYFRNLFMANKSLPVSGAHQSAMNEFAIVVSSFVHPPPATQFRWFLECAVQAPVLKDITDDTLETCMRLSKRFRAQGLELRCARYIQDNVNKRTPMVALCWLNWVLKHKFDRATHDACLPCVASASLSCLEQHRNMITEKLLADLLAAKLRMLYDQAVNVFQTIHSMDHFYVDVEQCPRCGRQREQGKVRVNASPCRRLLGCERCMKDYGCEITAKSSRDFQAFYQCQHGLTALNDHTPDCQCQLPALANHLSKASTTVANPLSSGAIS